MTRMRKLSGVVGAVIATTYGSAMILHNSSISASDYGGGSHLETLRRKLHASDAVVPSRERLQSALMAANKANPLDVLVIGGGATGTGAALDAVTRGLKVGLVEQEDFASGTSSRSTKLLHGGTLLAMK
ncbi:glycerol-3-phosphate dehydrogenase SDP6 mitochondrial-like [Trifolium pratense]|uniref:Glycerol-3-phosphate dehydrogenase n=1 Tax=Trifolium pratense TaxID=57577 RepID=A0A2K3M514_TRIPR|nr:glycerol-3-phosphate dehydrogenase SDP6 mitochondrial-like [Trifolium pratense]